LYLGNSHIAQSRAKANRALVAYVTAGLADDPVLGQALITDLEGQVPNGVLIGAENRLGAGARTFIAEGTLSTPKIDFRVASRAANDDAFWTGLNALTACAAAVQEIRLINRPGRAYRCRA
jgi:hypothetical protein